MIKTEIIEGDELPFRIQIDELHGAGTSPSEAVMAALSAGGKIPAGMRDKKDVARIIFWKYEYNIDWSYLIHVLKKDTFE